MKAPKFIWKQPTTDEILKKIGQAQGLIKEDYDDDDDDEDVLTEFDLEEFGE